MSRGLELTDSQIGNLLHSFYSQHFAGATPRIQSLGNAGGFSGARIWRIHDHPRPWCLRRWPADHNNHPDQLRWTHQILNQAFRNGCSFVPVPVPTVDGITLVSEHGFLWQLEPWMPGESSYVADPADARLVGAMNSLAQFHQSVAPGKPDLGPAPALEDRLLKIGHWYTPAGPTNAFRTMRSRSTNSQSLGPLASVICDRFLAAVEPARDKICQLATETWQRQPVIGDVRHDHLLFSGSQLTGLIDFGAMKIDHVSLDFGRLMGSLEGDNLPKWDRAAEIYRQTRPFSDAEFQLACVYDRSATLLSGLNWLHWICVENRQMGDPEVVFQRIRRIADRMETLVQNL